MPLLLPVLWLELCKILRTNLHSLFHSEKSTIVGVWSWGPKHLLLLRNVFQLHMGILLLKAFNEGQCLRANVAQEVVVITVDPGWTCCHSSEFFFPLFAAPLLVLRDVALQDWQTVLAHFILLAPAPLFAREIFDSGGFLLICSALLVAQFYLLILDI